MCSDEPDGQQPNPLSLTDKPTFDAALRPLAQPISDYTFANVFMWSRCLRLSWLSLHRHLCVFANGDDLTMLMPPMPQPGARDADMRRALADALDLMDTYNAAQGQPHHTRIEYISDEMLERLYAAVGRDFPLGAVPMSGDFVYRRPHMVELAGKSLKSKRHGKTRFMREYPDHHTEPLTAAHAPLCLDLLDRWAHHAAEAHTGQVTEDAHPVATEILRRREEAACRTAVRYQQELGLTGMGLFVGDRMVGFTLGESLSPAQASVLIEKTDPACHGAAQFIYSEFCRTAWPNHIEINAGDDWGIPTLRWTKESYRPSRRLNKYALSRPAPAPTALVMVPDMALPALQPQPLDFVSPLLPAEPVASTAPAPGPRVRRAERRDVDVIQVIEQMCFLPDQAFTRRQIRNLIANPRVQCAVAVADEAVIGWSVTMTRQHRRRRSGRVYNLAIHPDHRGRGAGRLLLDHAIAQLRAAGVGRVYLEVATTNRQAQSLYERAGFGLVRILRNYYGDGEHGLSLCLPLDHRPAAPDPAPTLWETVTA